MLLIIMFTWVGTADADLGPCRYQHPDPGNREGLKCDGWSVFLQSHFLLTSIRWCWFVPYAVPVMMQKKKKKKLTVRLKKSSKLC